jgi:hypothetical protein
VSERPTPEDPVTDQTRYTIVTRLPEPVAEARPRVEAASGRGFGVLTEIDVRRR